MNINDICNKALNLLGRRVDSLMPDYSSMEYNERLVRRSRYLWSTAGYGRVLMWNYNRTGVYFKVRIVCE
jgi:hypothetical protein